MANFNCSFDYPGHILSALLLVAVGIGCQKQAAPDVFANSQNSYAEAQTLIQNKEYEAAVELLTAAITGGGLDPEFFGQARLQRATCLARLGRYQEAYADLEIAAQGAAPDQVHLVRCFVYEKEGKKSEAADEFRKAKSFNRLLQRIE